MSDQGPQVVAIIDLVVEAFAELDAVGKRIMANQILRMAGIEQTATPATKQIDQRAAETFGATKVTFGIHKGVRWKDVPREYAEWLADNKRDEWTDLNNFLRATEQPA